MKIGMYSDEEILEHLTEGEGRGFLGRSMYDAIIGKIEQLTITLQAQEELTISWYKKAKQQNKETERLNNIIKKVEECIDHYAIENEDFSKFYNNEEIEILKIIGSDKE